MTERLGSIGDDFHFEVSRKLRSGKIPFDVFRGRSSSGTRTCYIFLGPVSIAVMNLRVTTSRGDPDIVVLRLAGHMAVGKETDDLEWLLRSLLRQGETKLIFDLAGVDQIDADAAVFLVRCFFAARGVGGELRLAAARPDVVRPFRATTLDALLSFDPTVTAACEHFTGGSKPRD